MVCFKIKNMTAYETPVIMDAIHTVLAGTQAYVDNDIMLSNGDTKNEFFIALGYDGSPELAIDCELIHADHDKMRKLKAISAKRTRKLIFKRRLIHGLKYAAQLAIGMSVVCMVTRCISK